MVAAIIGVLKDPSFAIFDSDDTVKVVIINFCAVAAKTCLASHSPQGVIVECPASSSGVDEGHQISRGVVLECKCSACGVAYLGQSPSSIVTKPDCVSALTL